MSSNELYKNPIGVDVTCDPTTGLGAVNLFTVNKWFSPNTSRIVGVLLKGAVVGGSDPTKVVVQLVITPNAIGTNPTYNLNVKGASATDGGTYTVLFVNEAKVSNYGVNAVYPC